VLQWTLSGILFSKAFWRSSVWFKSMFISVMSYNSCNCCVNIVKAGVETPVLTNTFPIALSAAGVVGL